MFFNSKLKISSKALKSKASILILVAIVSQSVQTVNSFAADGAAAAITSSSNLNLNAVNPSIVIKTTIGSDTFAATMQTDSFTVTSGTTQLAINSVTRDSATQVTLGLLGQAREGTFQISVNKQGFLNSLSDTSNTLSFTIFGSSVIQDETLTLSASSASVAVGETASVTITSSFLGNSSSVDSRTVVVTGNGADSTAAATYNFPYLYASNTDSANVYSTTGQYFSVASGTKTLLKASLGDSFTANTAATYTKGTFTLYIPAVQNVGTWTYTVVSQDTAKTQIFKSATFTLTVTAGNTTPVLANSDVQITDTSRSGYIARLGDSSIVSAAGAVTSTPAAAAKIFWNQLNSDSSATTTGGIAIGESVVVTVLSGPGTVSVTGSCVNAQYTATAAYNGSAIICNEAGKSGVTTVSIKTSTLNPWATKTLTFYSGTVDSFALATVSTGNIAGAAATYASQVTKTGELKVTAKDAGGTVISSGAPIYIYSSDTKVVTNYGAATCTSPAAGAVSYYACNLVIADSGTVTLTVGDSSTIALSAKTATLSVTIAGNAFTPTVAFDKTTYAPGEKAILTLTAKDSAGRNVANAAGSTGYSSVAFQGLASPTFGAASTAADQAGGSFNSNQLDTFLNASSATYYGGVDTVVVYMPSVAGTYTVVGKVGPATTATTLLTFTVVDATKDAADAATDAALEATDAAYAAQDAAQLAAESADAATAAAEAATAAAEAATAAVEDLATKVAGLFADLQKQITTLANVVAKIAKKVKA